MYQAAVNNGNVYEINQEGNSLQLNGENLDWDIRDLGNGQLHLIHQDKSYKAELVSVDQENKSVTLKLNGNTFTVALKDRYDLLLDALGMSNLATSKVNDLKAPMPGLIFSISVTEGQEVKKGDPLIILEAMKMENIIKSPTDGVVQQIKVEKGQSVEKNQVLILF